MTTRRLVRVLDIWRAAYGAEARRCLGLSVIAVPLALRGVLNAGTARAIVRALLALPVAIASSALTAVLAFLTLINVLMYPFRPYLGLHGNGSDNIWASRYDDSWGGPTLAGAWAVHAGLVLLVAVPAAVWAVRGLSRVQDRLTDIADARADSAPVAPVAPARGRGRGRGRRTPAFGPGPARRPLVTIAAATLFAGFSLTAHRASVGDNLLWIPRGLASALALAVTLSPLVGLVLIARTGWWRQGVISRCDSGNHTLR